MTSREDYKAELDHIAEVSKNARATWFGLIGTLLFSGVTLLSVQDRHFFEYGAATKLPILNFDVPIVGFFWTAPILVLALYAYLHIYLTKLWRALALLFAKAPWKQIDDEVYPWLLSDAAIRLKTGHRRDFGWLTALVSWALGWAFGPVILFFFWIRSWPRHDEFLTLFLGALFFASILLALESRRRRRDWMLRDGQSAKSRMRWAGSILCVVFAPLVALVSWETTEGGFIGWLTEKTRFEQPLINFAANIDEIFYAKAPRPLRNLAQTRLLSRDAIALKASKCVLPLEKITEPVIMPSLSLIAPAQLYRAKFVRGDWLSHDEAWTTFRREQRENIIADMRRGKIDVGKPLRHEARNKKNVSKLPRSAEIDATMRAEFDRRRGEAAKSLDKLEIVRPDFRRAYLREATLVGLDLTHVKLESADLTNAQLYGANLENASLIGADLVGADLQSSKLWDARLQNADLRASNLEQADLRSAKLIGATLLNANLREAQFFQADLTGAHLKGSDLRGAIGSGSVLKCARMRKADLRSADFSDANLSAADLAGSKIDDATFFRASFVSANLKNVPALTQELLDSVFGDSATVFNSCRTTDGICQKPDHWAEGEIPQSQWEACWQKWKKDGRGGLRPWETDRSAECTEYP